MAERAERADAAESAESSDDELPPAAQDEITTAVLESLEAHSDVIFAAPGARAPDDEVDVAAEPELPHLLRPLPALATDRPRGPGVIGIG